MSSTTLCDYHGSIHGIECARELGILESELNRLAER